MQLAGLFEAPVEPASSPSIGRAIDLEWIAPAECPQHDAVRDAIDLNLAREPMPDALVGVRAWGSVTAQGDRWELRVRTALGEREIERVVTAASCTELAEAAGLVIAVDLDPLRVLQQNRRPPEPPPREPARTIDDAPVLRRRVPERPPPPPQQRPSFDVRVGGLGELGSLTAFRAGVWAGFGVVWRRARLDVAGQYWAPRRVTPFTSHPDAGVRVSQGGVAVRGCYVPTTRRLGFATCGGLETGVARGHGIGLDPARTSHAPWFAVVIGQELSWISRARIGLWVALDAMAHVVRPRWIVPELGTAARTGRLGVRLVLGPTVRL